MKTKQKTPIFNKKLMGQIMSKDDMKNFDSHRSYRRQEMQMKTSNNLPNEQRDGDNKIANLTKEPRNLRSCPEGFTTSKRINSLKTALLHTALMCLL